MKRNTLFKNKKGMTAIDFLFAMVISMGIMSIIFAFSITFTAVEIVQYMTFASARSLNAGHANASEQQRLGSEKYVQLLQNPVIGSLFSGGWFTIPPTPFLGHPEDLGESEFYAPQLPGEARFMGSWVGFSAEVLDFEIPLIGATSANPGTTGNFSTQIGSFIGREPTQNECVNFNLQRYMQIIGLSAKYAEGQRADREIMIADNGC